MDVQGGARRCSDWRHRLGDLEGLGVVGHMRITPSARSWSTSSTPRPRRTCRNQSENRKPALESPADGIGLGEQQIPRQAQPETLGIVCLVDIVVTTMNVGK